MLTFVHPRVGQGWAFKTVNKVYIHKHSKAELKSYPTSPSLGLILKRNGMYIKRCCGHQLYAAKNQ